MVWPCTRNVHQGCCATIRVVADFDMVKYPSVLEIPLMQSVRTQLHS